jgi:uncharacterized protein involved in exopolysaccharide biosynthesis
MAQKISAQTELDLVLQYARPQSEEVGRLRARVEELSRQIGRVPATQAGGAEFMRRVVIEQQVFALLTAQLEEARIREAMDTPTIQVLDRAETPVRRYWPRRSWMALFGGLLGLTVCMARLGLGSRPGRVAA